METRYTPSGVRMRLHSTTSHEFDWLLLPGGPGIGSESLHELADAMDVPGRIWLVDLPGDGSNVEPAGVDPFSRWPGVLIEAVDDLPQSIFVGHSTGGMYLLATPALQGRISGLVLVDTAPDCGWHAQYVAMTQSHPLPAVDRAAQAYVRDKSIANLAALAVASAEWNFTPRGLEAGRALLGRMPYNPAAVEWSDAHFDHTYRAQWWPTDIPVLRLWGENDRIVSQRGWDAPAWRTGNVIERKIADAGHFPWIENPLAVRAAFNDLVESLRARGGTSAP